MYIVHIWYVKLKSGQKMCRSIGITEDCHWTSVENLALKKPLWVILVKCSIQPRRPNNELKYVMISWYFYYSRNKKIIYFAQAGKEIFRKYMYMPEVRKLLPLLSAGAIIIFFCNNYNLLVLWYTTHKFYLKYLQIYEYNLL
jgi:hypothetical protein